MVAQRAGGFEEHRADGVNRSAVYLEIFVVSADGRGQGSRFGPAARVDAVDTGRVAGGFGGICLFKPPESSAVDCRLVGACRFFFRQSGYCIGCVQARDFVGRGIGFGQLSPCERLPDCRFGSGFA